jgi:isohexenylglutaconyl-CoA hydratase
MTDILADVRDSVLFLTLNNPERRNALSDAVLDRFLELTEQPPEGLRAVVIRGAGGIFCAGGDIKQFRTDLQEKSPAEIAAYNRRYGEILRRLDELPLPVIAAVEGAAMGGGMGLASIADITIAHSGAKFALSETRIGLPPAQICAFVVARIGAHQSRRLMLTAAQFDAEEACRIGLADVISDDIDSAVESTLARIFRCAPGANAMTKQLIATTQALPLGATLDHAADLFSDAMLGDEAREGLEAFLQRRTPAWAGTAS